MPKAVIQLNPNGFNTRKIIKEGHIIPTEPITVNLAGTGDSLYYPSMFSGYVWTLFASAFGDNTEADFTIIMIK